MESSQVMDMISQALRAMAIGIPGVFAVLAVFYCTIKLMARGVGKKDGDE